MHSIFGKKQIISSISIIALTILLLFGACTPIVATTPISSTEFYFNTVIHLTFYNETDAAYADDCYDICQKYEQMFSRTVEGSDIYRINHSAGQAVEVSDETLSLIQQSITFSELTDGKVDITIAPLMDLWNYTDGTTTMPPKQEDIDRLLPHIGYEKIKIEGNRVTLSDKETQIDLGFIAKGYIADRLKEYLLSKNVTSAIIDLGGNILTIGAKPDNSPYQIGIQEPFSESNTPLLTESITDSSVVTSGIYERYFIYENTCYHHILDPKTGYPVSNNLYSVTILSQESCIGDALSTTCLLLGLEDAKDLIATYDNVEAIFITDDKSVIRTNQ